MEIESVIVARLWSVSPVVGPLLGLAFGCLVGRRLRGVGIGAFFGVGAFVLALLVYLLR
jgi:hypothetical protein